MADTIETTKIQNAEGGEPPKSAKQLEKEAKKQAKLDKLKQKLEKQNVDSKKDNTEVNIFPYVKIIKYKSVFQFNL